MPAMPSSFRLGLALTLAVFTGCATTTVKKPVGQAIPANQLLLKADRSRDPGTTIGLSLSAAEKALAVASDHKASETERAQAEQIYNAAVAECVLAMQKLPPWPEGRITQTFQADGKTYILSVPTKGAGLKNPATYDKLVDATKIFRKHLTSDVQRAGLGAPILGVLDGPGTKSPNRPPKGYAESLTAIAAFQPARNGATAVQLSFYEPRTRETVAANGMTFPLRADFTAPIAFFPRPPQLLFGIAAMLRSDRADGRTGIYFLEPFDPNKIPVIFVHGLMSSPHAWIDFINELNHDPKFRKRYQAWVFFYPSGGPIAGNAMRLRKELADLAKRYPLKHNIVLVGHSMGGILSRMQVTNSERKLWDSIFGATAETTYKMFGKDSLLKRALIFEANPYVTRVIFVATPHRGSNLANLRIAMLVGRLIRMPANFVHGFDAQTRQAVMGVNSGIRSVPSSIIGLSPRSPLLKGLDKLTIAVPYHSIIGNQGKDNLPLAKTSDGVVPYWSSHLDGAQSELIVPTTHDAFKNEKSVKEVLRILELKN